MSKGWVQFPVGWLFAILPFMAGSAAEPVITEFMAYNAATLLDEDGDTSDWFEIYNPGPDAVHLEGWYVTDDLADLQGWRVPAVDLRPGEFVVIFASEKARAIPGEELHTDFRLEKDGESLALVKPDGRTVVSSFSPRYPPQQHEFSYGCSMDVESSQLIPGGGQARVLIPADELLGQDWLSPDFDDSGWLEGTLPVGYDRKSSPTYDGLIATDLLDIMSRVNSTAYVRLPFAVADIEAIDHLLLRVRYDDGFVAYLNGEEVARRNAPDELTWDSRSSRRQSSAEALEPEQINLSAFHGLLRPGENVLAFHGLNGSQSDSDFFLAPELLALEVRGLDTDTQGYMPIPTPGWPNQGEVSGVTPDPLFSHPGGAYTENVVVSIEADSPETVIHLTVDRTAPTEESPVYTGPLTVARTTVVKARAYREGLLPSRPVSRTYFRIHASLADWSSNLPTMIIDTSGRAVSGSAVYTQSQALLIEAVDEGRSHWGLLPAWVGNSGIKLRGSSSRGFPKNNYSFEAWDELNLDTDVSLLGLPAHSDWVLHGPYSDKTLMRNYLAYKWSNDIGTYAPRGEFVELYLSASGTSGLVTPSHYHGVYLLVERIRRGDGRVEVERMYPSRTEPPDVAGGYIIKHDRLGPGESGFYTRRGSHVVHVYPQEAVITPAQTAYIKNFLDTYESALFGAAFRDPKAGYAAYIDADSFIDHHILTEMLKNIDGYRLSTYLFKSRYGKLHIGPLWDFNLSLGNADYLNGWLPQGWYYPLVSQDQYAWGWYTRLFQDPAFADRYRQRWMQLRAGPFRVGKLLGDIDATVQLLDEAQQRNFTRWRTLGTYIWPNWFIGTTYAEEIGFMRDWLADRVAWMDGTFVTPPSFSRNGGEIESGFELEITARGDVIYYTLDGTDPKTEHGDAPSPAALEYAGPLVLDGNTRVIARSREGGAWSAPRAATYVVEYLPLVITEIHADPRDPPEGSERRNDDFEFVEFLNIGSEPANLEGVLFRAGTLEFDFTDSSMTSVQPGQYMVLVRNLAAFSERYDTAGMAIAGEYQPRTLSDRRGAIRLEGPLQETLLGFTYDLSWYPSTQGEGYSLVIQDPAAHRNTWGQKLSWGPSRRVDGSPGMPDDQPGWQLPGDSNQDGRLNTSDAIRLLQILFGGAALPCDGGSPSRGGNGDLLDVNGDSLVNGTDAIHILHFLFLYGSPPSAGTACIRISGCYDACEP